MDVKDKLLRMMFPAEMLVYFEIVHVTQLHEDEGVEIELEEYTTVPL